MKFIQTIIAFSVIYLFVGGIALLTVVSVWLSSFFPTMPRQEVARLTVGPVQQFSAQFAYTPMKGTSAFITVFTRDIPQQNTPLSKQVLSAQSSVLFATFSEVTFSEKLLFLGYTKMYRLEKIVSADGTVVYQRRTSWIDTMAELLLSQGIQKDAQSTSFIASDKNQEYKIFTSNNGIEVIQ